MVCVCCCFRSDESEVVPVVMETLLGIPDDTHVAIKASILDLIAELARWLNKHSQFLGQPCGIVCVPTAEAGCCALMMCCACLVVHPPLPVFPAQTKCWPSSCQGCAAERSPHTQLGPSKPFASTAASLWCRTWKDCCRWGGWGGAGWKWEGEQ